MTLYYVEVFGCVEPEITGPFKTEEDRDEEAMKARAEQDDATDALFWLDVHEDGTAQMGAYSGAWADQAKNLYGKAR